MVVKKEAEEEKEFLNTSEFDSRLKTYNDYLEKFQALAFLSNIRNETKQNPRGDGDGQDLSVEAQRVFDQMFHEWIVNDKDDLEPTVEIYNFLIDIYANVNVQLQNDVMRIPEQILHKMEHGDMDDVPTPNIETYKIIMNGWHRSGNMVKVEQTLLRMEQRYHDTKDEAILPTVDIYNELLSSWLKSESTVGPQKAEDILFKLMDGGKVPTNIDENSAIGDDKSQQSTFNSYPGPDTKTFYLVMSCFTRDKSLRPKEKTSKIKSLLELMKDWKINNPESDVDPKHKNIANILIKASNTAIEAETILFDMIDLYQQDQNELHRPDAASFINTMNAWKMSRSNEAAQRSLQLLDLISELYQIELKSGKDVHDLKPDRRVYNAVQSVWSRSNEKNKAQKTKDLLMTLISKQKESGDIDFAPQLRQWNNVLNSCVYTKGSVKERKDAMKLLVATYNEMRTSDDSNIQPNHVTYGMFLKGCAALLPPGEQKLSIVENIFRKCCRDGHVSEFVFTALVEAGTPELCQELLGGNVYDGIQIPEEWARNL